MNEIEYYEDQSGSDEFYVCINRHHIFVVQPDDKSPSWTMLIPESEAWSAAHQHIYRNYRAKRITIADLPTHIPLPPDSVSPEAIHALPASSIKPIHTKSYPLLARYLATVECHAIRVFLVLSEDTYETLLGDGKFHYPSQVFFDESSLKELIDAEHDSYTRYHTRQGVVQLSEGILVSSVAPEMFDHFTSDQVLSLANQRIAQMQDDI